VLPAIADPGIRGRVARLEASVDRPTDRRDGLHLEDAGHRLTGRDAIEGVLGKVRCRG
jgi:hypothetical protein